MSVSFNNDLTVLAGTLYGEIRGGTQEQRENVAQVILNRLRLGQGSSIKGICLAPLQFSSWNTADPNRVKILNAPVNDPKIWAEMVAIATAALLGNNPNRVRNCTNYYAASMSTPPYWAKAPAVRVLNDGASIFMEVP